MPITDAVQRFEMRLSFSDQMDKAVLLSDASWIYEGQRRRYQERRSAPHVAG